MQTINSKAVALAIIASLFIASVPSTGMADNILRFIAPVAKVKTNEPVPLPDQGTPPSRNGLLMLFRFDNSMEKEGGSGLNMGFTGGSPSFTADSPTNEAYSSLHLNSNQGMASSSGPINGVGDFSVGTWLKTSQQSLASLIAQRDVNNDGQFNLLMNSTGQLCYWDYPGGTALQVVCSESLINDGNWHHIGMSRSGGTINLYIDGDLSYSGTFRPNC